MVAVGVVAVVAAIAVPVFVAAATPSPTIRPAVTAKPVNLPDDKGGRGEAEPGDDKGKGGDD
ncbi:MAG TPA: hypothetical protein VJB61_22525 [Actinomycetota bacterium]